MRWFLDVAYVALSASYKWLLGITAVAGILVGALFAAGVLGGGDSGDAGPRAIPTRVPAATPSPSPTFVPVVATPTTEPTAEPTATTVPTAQPTRVPQATPTTPAPVVAEQTQIAVMVQGAANVGSLEFVLTYDAGILEAGLVEPGVLGARALLEFNTKTPGAVWVAMADANGITGDGPVALITFTVLGSNGSSPLELVSVEAHDASSFLDFIVDAKPGTFTATDGSFFPPILSFIP